MRFKKLRGLWVPESYEEYEKPAWVENYYAKALYNHYSKMSWLGLDTSLESQADSAVNDLLEGLGFSVEDDEQ